MRKESDLPITSSFYYVAQRKDKINTKATNHLKIELKPAHETMTIYLDKVAYFSRSVTTQIAGPCIK
jgi:hypothetical protein